MNIDQLKAMRVFARIVERSSFTAVATEMGLSQSAVTKILAGLEGHLGSRLLNRTTRRVSLTADGGVYYAEVRRILEAVDEAESNVGKRSKTPSGLLRIAAPVAFGRLHVVPRIPAFLDQHPQIKLDLHLNDHFIDLVEGGIDVAIRIGKLADSSLRARLIGNTRRITVASPKYLTANGTPITPQDLTQHNCIVYTELATGNRWRFQNEQESIEVEVKGNYQANNSEAVREGVLAGLGIAVSPSWLFAKEFEREEVISLLPSYQPENLPIHTVLPPGKLVSTKARAFSDYLANEFRKEESLSTIIL